MSYLQALREKIAMVKTKRETIKQAMSTISLDHNLLQVISKQPDKSNYYTLSHLFPAPYGMFNDHLPRYMLARATIMADLRTLLSRDSGVAVATMELFSDILNSQHLTCTPDQIIGLFRANPRCIKRPDMTTVNQGYIDLFNTIKGTMNNFDAGNHQGLYDRDPQTLSYDEVMYLLVLYSCMQDSSTSIIKEYNFNLIYALSKASLTETPGKLDLKAKNYGLEQGLTISARPTDMLDLYSHLTHHIKEGLDVGELVRRLRTAAAPSESVILNPLLDQVANKYLSVITIITKAINSHENFPWMNIRQKSPVINQEFLLYTEYLSEVAQDGYLGYYIQGIGPKIPNLAYLSIQLLTEVSLETSIAGYKGVGSKGNGTSVSKRSLIDRWIKAYKAHQDEAEDDYPLGAEVMQPDAAFRQAATDGARFGAGAGGGDEGGPGPHGGGGGGGSGGQGPRPGGGGGGSGGGAGPSHRPSTDDDDDSTPSSRPSTPGKRSASPSQSRGTRPKVTKKTTPLESIHEIPTHSNDPKPIEGNEFVNHAFPGSLDISKDTYNECQELIMGLNVRDLQNPSEFTSGLVDSRQFLGTPDCYILIGEYKRTREGAVMEALFQLFFRKTLSDEPDLNDLSKIFGHLGCSEGFYDYHFAMNH
nr:TPA_asm: nucleoprotein [Grylloblatta bifratrilecta mononega-like virus]